MLLKTPAVELGTPAPAFSLPDVDGTLVSLETAMGPSGLVVAFICNHCPYVKGIVDRLVADAATLKAEGIGFVAIMSNDYRLVSADSPPEMKRFAERHGFGFPYLLDETQATGQAYGAVCTPDFFGYDADGALQYRGRLDDLGLNRSGERATELVDAMRSVKATGRVAVPQTASMGCSIKWSRNPTNLKSGFTV